MKTNPNSSATGYGFCNENTHTESAGLTIREHMAIEFTKAFITIQYSSGDECIRQGIITADKLIIELNKDAKIQD